MTSEQGTLDLGAGFPDPETWRDSAMETLLRLARRGVPFEPYDLTLEGLPPPPHPNAWGALFNQAAREGYITVVGFKQSNRPTRAAGTTRQWIGAEYAGEYQNVA